MGLKNLVSPISPMSLISPIHIEELSSGRNRRLVVIDER